MRNNGLVLWLVASGMLSLGGELQAQSIWKSGARAGYLFTDRTARRIGDSLTVVISESQSVQDQNNAKIERTSSFSTGQTAFRFAKHSPIFDPEFGWDSSKKLDAKADAQRSGTFTTTITATVIDVLPNGNLIVSGRRRLFVNQEEKMIEITGVVRPYDVSFSNTVLSSQIADARITFVGEGPLTEASKKGWLARGIEKGLNFLWPF